MKNEGYATKVTPDDDFDLGRECTTFSHMPGSQIPFLKYVHSLEQPHVLELGASEGRMVWKILLAGGRVLANDLYENQVQKAYNFVRQNIPNKVDYLTTDHGDAISIMERHPEIKGSFDIVLSQNLIHYLSPKNYSQFIKTAYD